MRTGGPALAAPDAASSQLGVPKAANAQLAAEQVYETDLGNPRDWKESSPNNFATPGG